MHVKDIFLATVDQPKAPPPIVLKNCLSIDIRQKEAASWQQTLQDEWVKEMQQKARLAAALHRWKRQTHLQPAASDRIRKSPGDTGWA